MIVIACIAVGAFLWGLGGVLVVMACDHTHPVYEALRRREDS